MSDTETDIVEQLRNARPHLWPPMKTLNLCRRAATIIEEQRWLLGEMEKATATIRDNAEEIREDAKALRAEAETLKDVIGKGRKG